MKRNLLTTLFVVMSFTTFFAQTTSNIVVFSEDGNPFYIVINGIKQNVEPKTNIKITGITARSNQLKIMFKDNKIPAINKAIYFDTMGYESTLKITRTRDKGYKLRYFDHVPINSAPVYNNQYTQSYSITENKTNTNSNVGNTNTNTNTNTNSNTNTNTNTKIYNQNVNTNNTYTETNNTNTKTNLNHNSNFASSVGLNYNWKQGASYQFSAIVVDNINTSMMGMNIQEQIKTTTDFVLYINGVDSNGNATGTLYLINYKVVDSKNNIFASINDIPKSAIKSEVSVDRKGKFTFIKKVYLITTATGNVLAYGNENENHVSVGGQAGNMKVDAYAEFNPKTGQLKTGYAVKEIKNTKKVEVKVNEETDFVDVFPYDFLELLALPDGALNAGDNMEVSAGMYKMNVNVTSMNNGIAQLTTKMTTDTSADMFGGGAKGKVGGSTIDTKFDGQGNVDGMSGMNNIMNMGSMNMTGEDKKAMDMTKAMSPNMDGLINYNFNYSEGMFQDVSGTINTSINAMGMKMTIKSVLQMKKK